MSPSLLALAQEPLTAAESARYAARESAAPGLEMFQGGVTAPAVWIGLLLLCVIITAVYVWVIEPERFAGR